MSAMFLTNGAIFANLVPRFPELKTELALSNTAYGVVVAAFPVGALVAGLTAGAVIRTLTSARTAVLCTVGIAVLVFAAGSSTTPILLAALLFGGGACDAITDVAQNTHGLRVQRAYGRSIINSMHAVWSVGAVIGAGMAAAAIALHVPIGVHLGVSAVVFASVALAAYPFLLKGKDQADAATADAGTAGRPGWRIAGALLLLVLIAIGGAVVEDAGSSWAALYLGGLGAPGAIAALGYVGLLGAQTVGRVAGDRMVDRFGERAVVRGGGLLVAVGMGLALAVPTVPGTIAGFAAAGIGAATSIPAAMHAADRLPGLRPGAGLTALAWLMRLGFVGAPPLVGIVSDAAGLRVGLLIVPIAGLAIAAAAGALSPRRQPVR
ncbi:MFS transporter [Mycobacterium yunnanensis]|uniref:MFS transporter n=2 Tax=Mycobacterium yunnanensis TaxID=368477 RepID=A0A9X3C2C0_9MYCO|nr:MFS transporter [Mycobacterium yunnanensis]